MVGQLDLLAEHAFDRILAHRDGTENHQPHQAVKQRPLDLDVELVVQQDCRAAEYENEYQRDPLHRLDLLPAPQRPGNLHNRCDNGNASRHVNIGDLVGCEKQDNGQKIEEQFHQALV